MMIKTVIAVSCFFFLLNHDFGDPLISLMDINSGTPD